MSNTRKHSGRICICVSIHQMSALARAHVNKFEQVSGPGYHMPLAMATDLVQGVGSGVPCTEGRSNLGVPIQ